MTDEEVEQVRQELLKEYPNSNIVTVDDHGEVIAEIEPGRAVAVIERSQRHFHQKMTETYRVLRGKLYVACGGLGHVLAPDDVLTIGPGKIHHARCVDDPAWVEVLSAPPWTADDHFTL